MRSLLLRSMIASALFLGACTATAATPATAPESIAPEATTTVATTTTSTTLAPTTTAQSPATTVDRKAEIEAIFQNLEQRRLTALYEGDREAFAALFANDGYLQRSFEAFELAEFETRPEVEVAIVDIDTDTSDCLAAVTQLTILGIDEQGEPSTVVLQRTPSSWGFSFEFEGQEGWRCNGPHPFS
jgi:hypothetical protein